MPSRLGDDPLARAGKGAAKPAERVDALASSASLDSFGGPATPQSEILSDSQSAAVALQRSYNDVFFLRRGAAESIPLTSQDDKKVDEAEEPREISEVFEIPEIREIASGPVVASGAGAGAAEQGPRAGAAEDAVAQGAIAIASPETVAPAGTGELLAQPATHVETPLATVEEPAGLPGPVADSTQSDALEPENSDGFIKKVFDKLGK